MNHVEMNMLLCFEIVLTNVRPSCRKIKCFEFHYIFLSEWKSEFKLDHLTLLQMMIVVCRCSKSDTKRGKFF